MYKEVGPKKVIDFIYKYLIQFETSENFKYSADIFLIIRRNRDVVQLLGLTVYELLQLQKWFTEFLFTFTRIIFGKIISQTYTCIYSL